MNPSNCTWRAVAATGLLACLVGACNPKSAVDQVLTPVNVDFGDLFALEDTIRLDDSVLIGGSWMLDVNSKGELLVHDTQSQGVYLFSPSGTLVRTMAITDCNPGATIGFGSQSSFLGDSNVLVLNSKGAIVFDQNGECTRTIIDADLGSNTWGICSRRDTVFAIPPAVRDSTFIRAYNPDFTLIGQFPLPAPKFPIRASVMLTYPGFPMACFDDDLWWVYTESHDAISRLRSTGLTRFMPDFFVERTRDYPNFQVVDQSNFQRITEMLDKAEAEATSVLGMFALDSETRMVVYDHIRSGNGEPDKGAVIASNKGRFPGVSTLLSAFPSAARNGMLYIASDPEDQSGGGASNPAIVRYRFVPPTGR